MSTIETDLKLGREAEGRRYAEEREHGEAATLERDIDATRADVRATLTTLERRLSFERLVEMTVGRIRDRGGEFAGNLTDTATQNPVPVLLTTIGLGWMMLMSRRGDANGVARPTRSRSRTADVVDRASSAADQVGDRIQAAGERLHDTVESSRQTLGETAESVRAGASRAAAATREQVDNARERMERLLDEQPLMLGALGLAAGALIGALLPTTEAEDRLIGDVRDKAVQSVKRTGRKGYEAARDNAAAYLKPDGNGADLDAERPSRPH
jgi:hypothetical protein